MVIVGFLPAEYYVSEGEGFVSFRIALKAGSLVENVAVEFYTDSGSAEGDNNFPVVA